MSSLALMGVIGISFLQGLWDLSNGYAYEAISVTDGGTIRGQARYVGLPHPSEPVEISKDQEICGKTDKRDESLVVGENQGLQYVVVSIVDIQKGKGFVDAKAVLDQHECRYHSHVTLVPVGYPLLILNNDEILHSVHTHSEKNPAFNRAQAKFKKEMMETFSTPETIKVTCDVHSWMGGWIIVQDNPYFSVTDSSGSFELGGVPAGKYVLRFWHEILGKRELAVNIESNQVLDISIRLSDYNNNQKIH
jgi:plastocyanin